MKFILTYKYGDYRNESFVDDSHIMQWLVKDVTFTLKEISNQDSNLPSKVTGKQVQIIRRIPALKTFSQLSVLSKKGPG